MRQPSNKISFLSATLINLNTIVGVGFFINISNLTTNVGVWSFLSYICGALLLFPVALSLAELAKAHPVAGGLFYYPNVELGPTWGFISGWSYFVAKTASFALLSHLILKHMLSSFWWWQPNSIPFIHLLFFAFILALTGLGVTVGGRIQYFFTAVKIIPFLIIITTASYFFSLKPFLHAPIPTIDIFSNVSIVAFAFASFEIICSMGHLVENGKKNIYRVVVTSLGTVVVLYTFLQGCIAGAVGIENIGQKDVVQFLFTHNIPQYPWLTDMVYFLIYFAVFGTLFTILVSNSWNFVALTKSGAFPFKNIIVKVNRHNIPWVSISFKMFCAWIMLLMTKDQIALQNMFVLSVCFSYGLNVLACAQLKTISSLKRALLCIPAAFSCLYLFCLSFSYVLQSGISFSFVSLYFIGVVVYVGKKYFGPTETNQAS